MGIGNFRHIGTLQAVTSIPDGGGGMTEAWVDRPPAWPIDIRPATVRDLERQTAGTTVATATHIIHGRFRPDVTIDDRILWDPGTDPVFPRDGLVAYWPLDEPGGVRRDRLGRANLTDHNGVGSGPGRVGVAAHFEQVNSEYVRGARHGRYGFHVDGLDQPGDRVTVCRRRERCGERAGLRAGSERPGAREVYRDPQ
jgi:head-tail adaptor